MTYSLGGIHEFVTEPAPTDWLKRLNPQWSVIVGSTEHGDAIGKAQAHLQRRMAELPNTVWGMRWWRDDKIATELPRQTGGDIQQAALLYADVYFKLHVRGSWLMVGNEEEASKTDPDVYRRVVAFHTAVTRLATDAGIPLGVCCTAMGEPEYGQYELLLPLFKAMQDARAKGIYHIWRPNTYFPHGGRSEAETASDLFNLAHRHQREGRRIAKLFNLQFPPTAFGEYNTVVSIERNLEGPTEIPGLTAKAWLDALLRANVDLPYAIYCYGDGLYNDQWKTFDLRRLPSFMEEMVARLPRRSKTLIEDWRAMNPMPSPAPTPPTPSPYPTPESLGDLIAGVVKKVAANWVNVRSIPSASATIVSTLRAGDKVQYRDPVIEAGAYVTSAGTRNTWRSVSNGWVAAEVITIEPDVQDKPIVALEVPFVSQLDADSSWRNNDCGVSCASMVLRYRFKQVGLSVPRLLTVNKLAADTPLSTADKPLALSALETLLDGYGVNVSIQRPLTPDAILRELEAGRPPILLVNYKHINPAQKTDMGHYVVVYAAGEHSFWLHDPYQLGANIYISREQLDLAMTDLGAIASFDYQGITLAA